MNSKNSKNHLTITGVLANDVAIQPERYQGRFTLIHHFGGKKMPLYLSCVIPHTVYDELPYLPARGVRVSITAYLRYGGKQHGIEALVKSITTLPNSKDYILFEYVDTERVYTIPVKDTSPYDFRGFENELILNTGESIVFKTEDGPAIVWRLLERCLTDGYRECFYDERRGSYDVMR